jgi:hypothetical protein
MTMKTSTVRKILETASRPSSALERAMNHFHFHTDLQDSVASNLTGVTVGRRLEANATVIYLTQMVSRSGDDSCTERLRRAYRRAELAMQADQKAKARA